MIEDESNSFFYEMHKKIRDSKRREKELLMKIYFKDKEIEEMNREIKEISQQIDSQEKELGPCDIYMNPALENEFQQIRKILIEKDKQIEKTDIQIAFQIQQHQQRAKDMSAIVKNDNAILGDYVNMGYTQQVEQEEQQAREKVIKLRATLTAINDDIKVLEKDHPNQVDTISSQKRLVNEEKRKKDDLKEELANYRDK